MNWILTENATPNAYKSGHWDGKNSDQVLAEARNGRKYLAHFCEGIIDGEPFADWYDDRDDLITDEIVRWSEILD